MPKLPRLRSNVVVVDTNVIQDLWSCADLVAEYAKGAGRVAEAQTREAVYRRARVREACILAWFLHQQGAETCSLPYETTRILTSSADPAAVLDFRTHFTLLFVWFVKDYVLSRWHEGTVPELDSGLKGTANDNLLLELCRRSGVPLITNEGYTKDGIAPVRLRAKALAAGVRVFTPREFWAGRIGEGAACRAFLRAFDSEKQRFLHGYRRGHPVAKTIADMRGYYLQVFFGLTSVPGVRFDVKL